jgi:hypothetical protein
MALAEIPAAGPVPPQAWMFLTKLRNDQEVLTKNNFPPPRRVSGPGNPRQSSVSVTCGPRLSSVSFAIQSNLSGSTDPADDARNGGSKTKCDYSWHLVTILEHF